MISISLDLFVCLFVCLFLFVYFCLVCYYIKAINLVLSPQQIANIAIQGTNERRYFTGVEGDKDLKGELFGIENLFSYRSEGVCLAQDIITRTDKLEAGLRMEKYNGLPVDGKGEEIDDQKVY